MHSWNADRQAGYDTALLASTRQEVTYLNALARQCRLDNNELGKEYVIGVNVYSVGDRVMTERNNYRLKVHNGQQGTIAKIDGDKMVVAMDNDQVVTLPGTYTTKHVALGYARTVYKAQGMTVDRIHIVATDRLHREAAYVAASRARQDETHTDLGTTHIYVTIPDQEQGTEHGHELTQEMTEMEQFEQAISTSAAQSTAAEYLDDNMEEDVEVEMDEPEIEDDYGLER